MKRKSILTLVCILIGMIGYAQNKYVLRIEDDTIFVDKAPYGIIEKKGGFTSSDFIVKSLDGKEQIMFQFNEFNDPDKINSGNPKGRVTYYEVTFLNSGGKCEVYISPGTKNGIAKAVVNNHLLSGNSVDAEAEKKFILVNGTKFTERKNQLAGPKVIIIEK